MSHDHLSVLQSNERDYSCRVCLAKKYSTGLNLEKNQHIMQLLEYCIGFTVNLQYASHMLCVKCIVKIEKFAKFKRKCLKSEQLWQEYQITKTPKVDLVTDKHLSTKIKEEVTEEFQDLNSEEYMEEGIDNSIDKNLSIEIKNIEQSSTINESLKHLNNYNKSDNWNVKYDEQNRKTYECANCKKIYNKYRWLLTHIKRKCCKNKLKIMKHKLSVKTENADWENVKLCTNECGLCDNIFSCDVKEHLNQHWYQNDLKCELCNYGGKDFANMITHRYKHCPKLKLRCHACDKNKFSILSLQFHFRSVHLHKPGGYCSICDKTFKIFKTWKRHHRLHTENNLFVCDHCERKFLYRHEIKSHLIDHSNLRQFVCETCGKGFKRISSLKEHIHNLHKKREPVKCGHCNKVYKCENKLKVHLRNVAKDKPFICDVCSKKFHSETILKKHMFWHTNERPFSCELCGSKYKAKGQLKVHMRNHTGVMPHKCVDCSKGFATGTQLKRHKSVHTGVRAFKCLHCERSFHAKKGLLEHASQHENGEGAKVET